MLALPLVIHHALLVLTEAEQRFVAWRVEGRDNLVGAHALHRDWSERFAVLGQHDFVVQIRVTDHASGRVDLRLHARGRDGQGAGGFSHTKWGRGVPGVAYR